MAIPEPVIVEFITEITDIANLWALIPVSCKYKENSYMVSYIYGSVLRVRLDVIYITVIQRESEVRLDSYPITDIKTESEVRLIFFLLQISRKIYK